MDYVLGADSDSRGIIVAANLRFEHLFSNTNPFAKRAFYGCLLGIIERTAASFDFIGLTHFFSIKISIK